MFTGAGEILNVLVVVRYESTVYCEGAACNLLENFAHSAFVVRKYSRICTPLLLEP
jgi:hypothetical protein